MTEPYVDPALPLHPNGATCADCQHIKKCTWLVGRKGSEVQCDWEPSKFVAKLVPPPCPRCGAARRWELVPIAGINAKCDGCGYAGAHDNLHAHQLAI